MDIFGPLLATDPASPRLTVYVDAATPARSSRMDFSAATSDNWVSKIANYLIDDQMVSPGDVMDCAMPARWQTAFVLCGLLRAGVGVRDFRTEVPADSRGVWGFVESAEELDSDVFSSALFSAADAGVEAFLLPDDPWGRSVEDAGHALPEWALDVVAESRIYPDRFTGTVIDSSAPALVGGDSEADVVTFGQVESGLEALAPESLAGISAGDRVLIPGWHTVREFVSTAVYVWSVGGSVVVHVDESGLGEDDLARRRTDLAAIEKVTRIAC